MSSTDKVSTIRSSADAQTQRDRQDAVRRLEESAREFEAAVSGLTDAHWRLKPSADRWSISECVEHVVIVEERVFGLVAGLAQAPPGPTPAAVSDDEILARTLDRSTRFAAPERIHPTGRWADQQAAMAAFEAVRRRAQDFLRTTEVDLRARTAPHPVFGQLDAHQWMLAMSAHSLRHVAQIEEIKAGPGVPR